MTRNEVVKGLEQALALLGGPCEEQEGYEASESVREAIALLTPPTTDEIEAAREVVEWWRMNPSGFRPGGSHLPTILKALDALAREPGTESTLHRKNCRIAELEARLERVREVVAQMPPDDACFACRAALAADAEPTRERG